MIFAILKISGKIPLCNDLLINSAKGGAMKIYRLLLIEIKVGDIIT